jgi:uncharacterized membrane protein
VKDLRMGITAISAVIYDVHVLILIGFIVFAVGVWGFAPRL